MTLHAHIHRRTYTQAARTSLLAVASMALGVLGILSLLSLMQGFSLPHSGLMVVVGPYLALIFGYVAKDRIGRSGGTLRGRRLAIAAIVLGWIVVGAGLVAFVHLVVTLGGPLWGS